MRFFMILIVLGGIAGFVSGCAVPKELIAPCKRPAEMKPFAPISQMDCKIMMPVNYESSVSASPENIP